MILNEREKQAVSLIKERYPYINNTTDAFRAGLLYLAYGELPVAKPPPGNDEWITVNEAARILSNNSEDGHKIDVAYVANLAGRGYFATREEPGRGRGGIRKLYNASDVRNYRVKRHPDKKQQAEQLI